METFLIVIALLIFAGAVRMFQVSITRELNGYHPYQSRIKTWYDLGVSSGVMAGGFIVLLCLKIMGVI